jgi:coenzyme F420-dependent glucose-6-phosphate dehydrogenase
MLLVITNAEEGIKRLKKYADLGFTEIVLTNSSPDREKLVKLIAKEISPALR